MSLTITEAGKVLTETQDGVTFPADYSFATVNDYVHSPDRIYEELECLCLGMASHIDKLDERNRKLNRCSRCLKQTDGIHTCTPTPAFRMLEQQRDELLAACEKAAEVFDFYAKHHATKTVPEDDKAQQNYKHRNMCRAAIANAKGGAA